jgi:hypothetical protein
VALTLVGCPVGAELDDPLKYDPTKTGVTQNPQETTGGVGISCDTCGIDAAMATCDGSVCHGGPPGTVSGSAFLGGGLDLFSPTRDSDLLDRPATYLGVPAADLPNCPEPPELLIDSQNPEQSLMSTKVYAMYSCGSAMPAIDMDEITDADRQCIRDWVMCLAIGAAASSALEVGQ